jgi:ABC-2 type transport system ATP-binding protein
MSISVSHLSKTYGSQKAVNDISFEVEPGQVVGFLGPNGAGKTTTMKILTCYIPQSSGTAKVCGFDVQQDPLAVRKKIGYLPEHNPLYLEMYVTEYLRHVAGFYGLGKKGNSKVEELIERTGLKLERRKRIGQLSKGYRQRVGLAQALLHDPEVLILDEPTSGLDPNQLSEIRQVIRDIGKEKTVLFSTHIMQEVQAICDRVIIINRGQIMANDDLQELKRKHAPKNSIEVEWKEGISAAQLTTIPEVDEAKEIGPNKWKLSSGKSADLREVLFQFAKEKNHTLLGLKETDYSLEDIFKKLTGRT